MFRCMAMRLPKFPGSVLGAGSQHLNPPSPLFFKGGREQLSRCLVRRLPGQIILAHALKLVVIIIAQATQE